MQHNADTPQKPNQNSNNNNLPQQAPPNPPPLPLPIDFGGKISRVRREIPGLLHLINNDELFGQFADMAAQSKIESEKQFNERLATIEQELAKLKEGDENYEKLQTEKSQLQKYLSEDALEFQKLIDSKFQAGRDEIPMIVSKLENERSFMYSFNILVVVAVEFLHILDLYNRKDEANGGLAWKAFERNIFPMLNNSVHRIDYKSRLLALAEKYNVADSTEEELIKQPGFYNEGMEFFFSIINEANNTFEKMSYAYALRQMRVSDVEPFMYYIREQYGHHFLFYTVAEDEFTEYKDIIGEAQYEKAMGWIKAQREAFYASDETSCDFCKHKFSRIADLQSFVNVFKSLREMNRGGLSLLEASDEALMNFIFTYSFDESLSLFSFEEIEKCFDAEEITEESLDVEDTEEELGFGVSDELVDMEMVNALFGEIEEESDEIMRWNGDLEEFIDIFRQMNTPTDFEDSFFKIKVDALAKILDDRFVWMQNDLPLVKVLMCLYDEPYTGAYKHDVQVLMKG